MIPKLHYIANATTASELLENVQKACSSGIELVQLNMQQLPKKDQLSLAQEVHKITSHFQTRLIIMADYELAKTLKADGVYLDKKDACPSLVRKQLHSWQSIGAAAHTLEDCEQLIGKDVDYITLSPFKETKNTNTIALGLNGYSLIIESLNTKIPVLAYGGISEGDVTALLEAGVSGLSIDDVITANPNSIRTFHQLLNASSTQEMRHSFKKK